MRIQSVQEYISLIERLKGNYPYRYFSDELSPLTNMVCEPRFIFRGHSCHPQYDLIPQIFRWKKIDERYSVSMYSQIEYNIINDFISEACRFIKTVSENDIAAWIEIAQHFGVPTRLLDFTENPLVALYFACVGSPESNAAVWVLNEFTYNRRFFQKPSLILATESQAVVTQIINQEIIYQDYKQHTNNLQYIQAPWIYKPHYREEWMTLQSSVFLLWGADVRPLTALISDRENMQEDNVKNVDDGILCCIEIPSEYKKAILKQLDDCGINEKFIYPGIDGVGRYINKKYSSDY